MCETCRALRAAAGRFTKRYRATGDFQQTVWTDAFGVFKGLVGDPVPFARYAADREPTPADVAEAAKLIASGLSDLLGANVETSREIVSGEDGDVAVTAIRPAGEGSK